MAEKMTLMYVALVSVNGLKGGKSEHDYCFTKATTEDEAVEQVTDRRFWEHRYGTAFVSGSRVEVAKIHTFTDFIRERGNLYDRLPENGASAGRGFFVGRRREAGVPILATSAGRNVHNKHGDGENEHERNDDTNGGQSDRGDTGVRRRRSRNVDTGRDAKTDTASATQQQPEQLRLRGSESEESDDNGRGPVRARRNGSGDSGRPASGLAIRNAPPAASTSAAPTILSQRERAEARLRARERMRAEALRKQEAPNPSTPMRRRRRG